MSDSSIFNGQSVNSVSSGDIVKPVEIQQDNIASLSHQTTSERTTTHQTTSRQTQTTAVEGVQPNLPPHPLVIALYQGGAVAAILFISFLGMNWLLFRTERLVKTVLTTKK